MKVFAVLKQLVFDDRGQDLVEYGLLASIIAIAGYLLFPQIKTAMDAAYSSWTTGAYNQWCPDDPGGGATCSTE
jgi:Flp pilus assembly pilin Flp